MMRKIAIGLAVTVVATAGATLSASAYRGGDHGGGMAYHHGGYGKDHGGYRPGHWETRHWSRWGKYPRYGGYGGGGSCWRWVTTDYGQPRRVWVCGSGPGRSYGTYRYGGSYGKWVPGRHPGHYPGHYPNPHK